MRRLRSPGTRGRWAIVLGLLLAAAPLLQPPCSRAAVPQSTAPEVALSTAASGTQWACSETAVAPMIRAVSVSSEQPTPLPGPLVGRQSSEGMRFDAQAEGMDRGEHRLRGSPVLRTLRPVVLQI